MRCAFERPARRKKSVPSSIAAGAERELMDALFGVLAAFATAAAQSATDIFTKMASSEASELRLLTITWATSAAILIAITLICYPSFFYAPSQTFMNLTGANFVWALPLDGVLNVLASLLYIRAMKHSDASLVAPMMFLTPAFMMATSPLMLNESISFLGAMGVLLAACGSYLLGVSKTDVGFWAPFQALAKDRGVRSMLAAVAIWSVTSNLDKIGVLASTPLIWSVSMSCFLACGSSALLYFSREPRPLRAPLWRGAGAGLGQALQAIFQNIALGFLNAPYVIAIKRTSAVMTVLASGAFLKEDTRYRMAGSLIMASGTVLIIFAISR
jgi:drug/metabolite transporter (DMT)-like permease